MSELEEALAAWGAEARRLIKDRENAVYEVRIGGARAALRLHRPGYQDAAAIRSEMDWMGALAEAGVPVPAPIPTRAGGRLATLSTGRIATAIGWVDGEPIGDAGVPLRGSVQEQEAMFHRVGRAVARLHNVTDGLTLPEGFIRHAWDAEGLLGETPFWGRFWESPALSPPERALLLEARRLARIRLDAFAARGGDHGLIHADVLRENVFLTGETVTLIDFDDCGFGFRLYDLATLMSQNEEEPAYSTLRAAAVAGYRAERSLSDDDAALLDLFIMLRRFASAGWVVPRSKPGDPRLAEYAGRAVRAAKSFLISV